jgi:hypothetical protein
MSTTTSFDVVADPFPHCIVDGFWPDRLLEDVVGEFPAPHDERWQRFANQHEGKLGCTRVGSVTRFLFEGIGDMAGLLSRTFQIPDLVMETVGGGYHLIPPGGHLGVHTDFNRSPSSGLYRRLNLLVYLNRDWTDLGGCLELWPDVGEPIVVAPEWNRTVIFETSDRSWHGHPKPAKRWRKSVAAYFFSPEPPPGFVGDHSTVWR